MCSLGSMNIDAANIVQKICEAFKSLSSTDQDEVLRRLPRRINATAIAALSPDGIYIKKPIVWGMRSHFNVYYYNRPLIIQTPIAILASLWRSDNDGRQITCEIATSEMFVNQVETLINTMLQRAIKRKPHLFANRHLHSPILGLTSIRLRASTTNIQIQEKIPTLHKGAKYGFMFRIDSIWAAEHYYGINLALIKITDVTTLNTQPMQVEDTAIECAQETISETVCLDKYKKMLVLGVPKEAVKHKMMFDGFDADKASQSIDILIEHRTHGHTANVLNLGCNSVTTPEGSTLSSNNDEVQAPRVSRAPPAAPPPPPPPMIFQLQQQQQKGDTHAQMMKQLLAGGIKLKPTVKRQSETEVSSDRPSCKSHMLKTLFKNQVAPPCLEEILLARGKLKPASQCNNKLKQIVKPVDPRTFLDDIKEGTYHLVPMSSKM